jgi:hypothetical protein
MERQEVKGAEVSAGCGAVLIDEEGDAEDPVGGAAGTNFMS